MFVRHRPVCGDGVTARRPRAVRIGDGTTDPGARLYCSETASSKRFPAAVALPDIVNVEGVPGRAVGAYMGCAACGTERRSVRY